MAASSEPSYGLNYQPSPARPYPPPSTTATAADRILPPGGAAERQEEGVGGVGPMVAREALDFDSLRSKLATLEVSQREQEVEIKEERRHVALLCAQHDQANAELKAQNTKLMARSHMLTEQLQSMKQHRDDAIVSAQRLVGVVAPRLGGEALLRWCLAVWARHVAAAKASRKAGTQLIELRQEAFAKARALATSVGSRQVRKTAQLLVMHLLKTNARANKAARAGVTVHFAQTALERAEKERREAASMVAAAMREKEDAMRMQAGGSVAGSVGGSRLSSPASRKTTVPPSVPPSPYAAAAGGGGGGGGARQRRDRGTDRVPQYHPRRHRDGAQTVRGAAEDHRDAHRFHGAAS